MCLVNQSLNICMTPHHLFDHAIKTLKPKGKAVIMTPSWEHNMWGPFYIDHTHVTPFTKTSLEDLFVMSGFKNVEGISFLSITFCLAITNR